MAKTTVEDAKVERVFQSTHGWGVRVEEPFTRRDGGTSSNFFTLWFNDQPNLMQGNVISAEGRLGWKVRHYEQGGVERETVDVSLHDAVVLEAGAGGAVAAPVAPSQQSWHLPVAPEQEAF